VTQPGEIRWATAGTAAKPAGVPLKLTDERRGVLAEWIDADTPAPTPTPLPVPTPSPPPAPGRPPRTRYGPATWGTASSGGGLKDAEIIGTPPQAAADVHGVRVTAPKQAVSLSNVWLRGWSNGLTVEHAPAVLSARLSKWRLEYCLFADNSGPPAMGYRGQGAYLAAADDVTFFRCWFVNNGRAADRTVNLSGRPFVVSSGFHKGCYVQGGLTQWNMPEGCRRVRFEECVFVGNAAEGLCGKGDGTEVYDCFFAGNAWGCMVNGPLPSVVAGNVIIPGPRAVTWNDPRQFAGAGGVQWRAAFGTLENNLCVLPPQNRMPDRNWRAPAFEAVNDPGGHPAYQGPVRAVGSNNVALGWDDDYAVKGPVPGFRKGLCPTGDWAGLVARAEAAARNGTADAAMLISEARRMAGVA
jgi:hypothetical protein